MTDHDTELAREIIEGFDEEICSECEGSGLVYADRKAHYPHSNAPTVPCSYCHEGKRAISDETRIEMIAQALRSVREEEREACAEIAQKFLPLMNIQDIICESNLKQADVTARAIRNRMKEKI